MSVQLMYVLAFGVFFVAYWQVGSSNTEEDQLYFWHEKNTAARYAIPRQVLWCDNGTTWYIDTPVELIRIAYVHRANDFADVTERAFYVTDSDAKRWYRIEHPSRELLTYLKQLPVYGGHDILQLTAADLEGEKDIPAVDERQIDEETLRQLEESQETNGTAKLV